MVKDFFPVTLAIDLITQRRPGDCLVACALMVLRSLKMPVEYSQLARILGTTEIGTPFSRLARLNSLDVQVTIRGGTLPRLHQHLAAGLPCIVSVETRELPYWHGVASPHAVVVCGMDQRHIQLLDPGFVTGPFLATHGDFDLAWLERDEEYAVVTRLALA